MNQDIRAKLLLSVQRALLGVIPGNVRKIQVQWHDKKINLVVFYEKTLSESDKEDLSCAETEIIADFPAGYEILPTQFIQRNFPSPIEEIKDLNSSAWVYERKE